MEIVFDLVVKVLDKAALFAFGDEEAWAPLSMIRNPDYEDKGVLDLSSRLFVKEGLGAYGV